MKLCFLSAASVIHTVRWVNAMVNQGHDVHLMTMHDEKVDKLDRRVTIHRLNIPAPLGYYLNVLQAKKIIRKLQPDILHVHYASGYGTLSRLINYQPTLLSVWGTDVYLFPYESKQKEKILRKNLQAVDYLSSTSIDMKKQTEKFISHKPIDVVPFGIELNDFQPGEKESRATILIGTVKKLEHVYGIDLLLKSVASLITFLRENQMENLADQIRLQIVGEGPQRLELQALADELKIGAITEFVGLIPNEDVPEYLNNMDIFVALSRSESFGVAVLEASACEVPVVVSDVGGLPEVVDEGKTGYSLAADNTDQIVKRLAELVSDAEKRFEMGKAGREFVKEFYSWDKNVCEMEAVYSKICNMETPK